MNEKSAHDKLADVFNLISVSLWSPPSTCSTREIPALSQGDYSASSLGRPCSCFRVPGRYTYRLLWALPCLYRELTDLSAVLILTHGGNEFQLGLAEMNSVSPLCQGILQKISCKVEGFLRY